MGTEGRRRGVRRHGETRAAASAAATAGLVPVRQPPFVKKGEGAELEGETRRDRIGRSAMCKHDRSPSVDMARPAPLIGITDNDRADGFAREKCKNARKKLSVSVLMRFTEVSLPSQHDLPPVSWPKRSASFFSILHFAGGPRAMGRKRYTVEQIAFAIRL